MIIRMLANPKKIAAVLISGLISCAPQWLHAQNAAGETKAQEAVPALSPAEIELGKKLFQGTARFAEGGPSCISCHHVQNDTVAPGGTLAVDLTTVVSRSGAEAVHAMLPLAKADSPFPVMQAAYQSKRLTDNEANALRVFLQHADQQQASQAPGDFGYKMFFGSLGGVAAMLMFFALIGRRRKKQSVNQHIYDRQLKTE